MRTDPTYVLAKIMATTDGKLEPFLAEEEGSVVIEDVNYTGHFSGYLIDATGLIEALEAAGFKLIEVTRQ